MHIVVIGAGVFGAWTAYHLHARGAAVTLVDAYGPANSRSSSGDETRIVRCGYGPDAIYSDLARRSRDQWRVLHERFGRNDGLWHESGVLWITTSDAATVGYPLERINQIALDDDASSDADGGDVTTG